MADLEMQPAYLRIMAEAPAEELPVPITRARLRLAESVAEQGADAAAVPMPRTAAPQLQRALKRLMDVAAALLGLIVLSPFLFVTAVVIRLESKGPAFFRQSRVGKGGVPFTFYKFRTMVDGNDPAIHQEYVRRLITEGSDDLKGDDGCFKIERDPRVTRFGGFLRRSSIDELPQLLNVLLGDMSLVGPRPPLPYEVELYSPRAMRRLDCRPGITGLWQVSGRCSTTFDDMVDLDISYQQTWSLWSDLKILVRTVPAVLRRKGAW